MISALPTLTFDSAPDFPVTLMLTFEAQMTPARCSGEAPDKSASLSPRGDICSEVFLPCVVEILLAVHVYVIVHLHLMQLADAVSFDQAVIHGP